MEVLRPHVTWRRCNCQTDLERFSLANGKQMMNKKIPDDFSLICDLRSQTQLTTSAQQLRWIKSSSIANMVYIVKNSLGKPTGYIIWACISKETLARINRTGIFPQNYYEWNEGYITLILDILLLDGLNPYNRRQLLWFLKGRKIIAYCRNKKLSLLFRKHGIHRRIDKRNEIHASSNIKGAA